MEKPSCSSANAPPSNNSEEDRKTEEPNQKPPTLRIPVVGADGRPLMPTTPQRARKLLKGGAADKRWNKLGQFYIQMQKGVATNRQELCLAVDPGSKWDGIAILSKKQVVNCGMLILPSTVADKLLRRRWIRRGRRYRKTRRRAERFDNKRKHEGWVAPSQKSKVDFRTLIVNELCKLYPVRDFAVEDVRFNSLKRRWNRHASTAEQGKMMFYRHLAKIGKPTLYLGYETARIRERLGLHKSAVKGRLAWDTHAVDAITIGCAHIGCANPYPPEFWTWRRFGYFRRHLHWHDTDKRGIRRRYGGTWSLSPFKKGDVVWYHGKLARVGGFRGKRISLHSFDLENKRFTTRAKPDECKRLFNQQVFCNSEKLEFSAAVE